MAKSNNENLYKRRLVNGWTYYARLMVEQDGVTIRKCFNLRTQSLAVARRKLVQLQSQPDQTAPKPPSDVETVTQATKRVVEAARKEGMRTYRELECKLQLHVLPFIGDMHVDQVRPKDIRMVLEDARERGLAKQSLVHLRNSMNKVFDSLWRDEDIPNNPVKQVKIPAGAHQDHRERVHLTSQEFDALIAYLDEQPDEERINGMPVRELQTMCIAARCIGGQRTSDLHAWRWSDIDLDGWGWCYVRRPKTERRRDKRGPSDLSSIQHPLQPGHRKHLRRWWLHEGKPTKTLNDKGRTVWRFEDGRTSTEAPVVFPARSGKRAGEQKAKSNYAAELREALRRAFGLVERRQVELKVMRKNGRQMRVKRTEWAPTRPMTERERMVLEETDGTLPTDFHTFRHAYCTGLAAAGVNLQMQMALAGHTQAQTAMRYTQLAQTDQQQAVQGIPDVPSAGLRLVG